MSQVLGPCMPCIVEVSTLGSVQNSVEFVESVGSATRCRASSIICLISITIYLFFHILDIFSFILDSIQHFHSQSTTNEK